MSTEQTTQPARRPDVAVLVIALLLAGLAALVAWDAANLGGGGMYASVGPKDFPYMIAGGLGILAVWTAVEGFTGAFPKREPDRVVPMVWVIGGLVAQIVLIGFAGFAIATGVMFGMVARGFGAPRLWVTIPSAIIFCIVIYAIFHLGLELTLPAGPLEQAVDNLAARLLGDAS